MLLYLTQFLFDLHNIFQLLTQDTNKLEAWNLNKLEAYLRKAIKLNYAPPSINTIDHIFNKIDNTYFKRVITDPTHLLHPLLPPQKAQQRYTLRKRPHNFCLPIKHDTLFSANFIIRMLYSKNSWLVFNVILFITICMNCVISLRSDRENWLNGYIYSIYIY